MNMPAHPILTEPVRLRVLTAAIFDQSDTLNANEGDSAIRLARRARRGGGTCRGLGLVA